MTPRGGCEEVAQREDARAMGYARRPFPPCARGSPVRRVPSRVPTPEMSSTPRPPLLLACLPEPGPADLEARLAEAGVTAVERCACSKLVQRCLAEAPDQVMLVAPAWSDELSQALAPWNALPPCPVLLCTPSIDEADAVLAVECGVHHWIAAPGANAGDAMRGAMAWARAREARVKRLQGERADAVARLEDRKWIDRAKGVLMNARGLNEDEAFRLLRGAAMNVNLKLGEISRAVTEAAQWADAVNRAGQFRMLSQRLVRLAAQRLLGVDPKGARVLQAESMQRLQDNVDVLAAVCAGTEAAGAFAVTLKAWSALQASLAHGPELPGLGEADTRADALREAAESLVEALERLGGRRALHVVNVCGRQRMHVQRAAKCALVASLRPEAAGPDLMALQGSLDAFEQAQRELEEAPLSSPQIRASLEGVRDEWLRLLGGLRAQDPRDGQRALVHASEVLLARLDELTAAYEHSLQVIMG